MWIKKEWWGEGLTIFDTGPEIKRKPLIVRKAMAFEKVLREMPISVAEDELIVGNLLMNSLTCGNLFPEYATSEEKEIAARNSVGTYSVWGHSLADYPKVLNSGLAGIRSEAKQLLEKLESQNDSDETKRDFLHAVIICCNAVRDFAQRYADLAAEVAEREMDIGRKQELAEITRVCRRVPEWPARSFHEALQSLWFVHIVCQNTLNWVPIGRCDQYLYPFYEKDLKDGRITKEQAQEVLECVWIKFNERMQLREEHLEDHSDPYLFSLGRDPKLNPMFRGGHSVSPVGQTSEDKTYANQWLQSVTLGGQMAEGLDATNEVTYMCLEATEKVGATQPIVQVRFHRNSPERLLETCCEVISSLGGRLVLLNDEARLPILLNVGIPLEDVRQYSGDGCWEMEIPGKTEMRWSPIHSLKAVEWVFNRGYSPVERAKLGIDTGDVTKLNSFNEVMRAFELQLDHAILTQVEETTKYYGSNYAIAPCPFFSSLIEGCMEKARDITQGGAKYILHHLWLTGLPNTVDSLAAIKKFVFEDRVITLAELKKALDSNFEGCEDLWLALLHRAPKYGNDDDYVDEIAVEVSEYFVNRVREHATNYPQIKFPVGIGTTPQYVLFGKLVGATPDGRKSGDALAGNFSPAWGAAKKGITAAIKSFTKICFQKLGVDSELDLAINPNFVKTKEGLSRLAALIRSFMDAGGTVITFNVIDAETLRKAQKEPENYRDLTIRLGGWQAFFVSLDRAHQDAHIHRITHEV